MTELEDGINLLHGVIAVLMDAGCTPEAVHEMAATGVRRYQIDHPEVDEDAAEQARWEQVVADNLAAARERMAAQHRLDEERARLASQLVDIENDAEEYLRATGIVDPHLARMASQVQHQLALLDPNAPVITKPMTIPQAMQQVGAAAAKMGATLRAAQMPPIAFGPSGPINRGVQP